MNLPLKAVLLWWMSHLPWRLQPLVFGHVLCIGLYLVSFWWTMNSHNRNWNILCWNFRGLNSFARCQAAQQKIDESACSIFCLQETKKDLFDAKFVKTLAPKWFDNFFFSPSVGASRGVFIGWCSSMFSRVLLQQTQHALVVSFTSKLNGQNWVLINVYSPSHGPQRDEFVQWLQDLDIANDYWMILGDFC